jgi:hypothetical protein
MLAAKSRAVTSLDGATASSKLPPLPTGLPSGATAFSFGEALHVAVFGGWLIPECDQEQNGHGCCESGR